MSSGFQRVNVYNRHLPYKDVLEADADAYFDQLKTKLREVFGRVPLDCVAVHSRLDDIQKYMILYGMRFSKEDHVRLIQWHLQLLHTSQHLELYCFEKICKILHVLMKKKYLLSRKDTPELVIQWRPLYKLLWKWDQSSGAMRGTVRVYDEVKAQLRSLIKASRGYFPEEATQEMLDEFRPMLCSTDRSMWTGFKYLNLFLPTTGHIDPDRSYKIWFDEFFNLWSTFSNGPAWEVDLFMLMSRLALHHVGKIDWSGCVEPFFTRFMIALGLPVTYAGSHLKISFGMNNSAACLNTATRWIVSAMKGPGSETDCPVQKHLGKMLKAIESYFHPANVTGATDGLHLFVSLLCTFFTRRIHLERYNTKWPSKTPPENRLTDDDVTNFVESLVPITFHVLYNHCDEDKRNIFNCLATLKPDLIIPRLLERMHLDVQLLNTPHRFTSCVTALSACSRTLVEKYPLEVINLLEHLLPGINVNDMFKSTDIFILISDLLDMVYMIDFTGSVGEGGMTEEERKLCLGSAVFEDFVVMFVDKCLTLVEHSSREQTRQESDTMEECLNEEEIAADCTISDTFQKLMTRISRPTFLVVFDKIKRYVDSRILEPAVAGAIMAAICKACTNVEPELTLKFLIPHLCERIETILAERVNNKKSDHELQYVLKLMSEIVSLKGMTLSAKTPSNPILPYITMIQERVLAKALALPQKDEYDLAATILSNVLYSLTHTRPVTTWPAQVKNLNWSKDYEWARAGDLDSLQMEWYVPGEAERRAAEDILGLHCKFSLAALSAFAKKEVDLDKESVVRHLRVVQKCVYGAGELLPPLQKDASETPPTTVPFVDKILLRDDVLGPQKVDGGVRNTIFKVLHEVKEYLLASGTDNTEALNMLVANFEDLMSAYGVVEEDLNDHLEDHKILKMSRENKMVREKRHIDIIQYDRVLIQHECHMWLKNFITMKMLPKQLLLDVFDLSVSHYSDVRIVAQGVLSKLLMKSIPEGHLIIQEKLLACLTDTKKEESFKGALHILMEDRAVFFGAWKFMAVLLPALIKAQGSDKNSIVELLRDHSYRCNRTYQDCVIHTLPVKKSYPSKALLQTLGGTAELSDESQGSNGNHANGTSDDLNPDFVRLEKDICQLILHGNLHWRHFEMAVGMLFSIIVPGYRATEDAMKIWLDCLIHDDRNIRLVAFQAVECIIKVSKSKREALQTEPPPMDDNPHFFKPGARQDNSWLQYDPALQSDEGKMEEYFKRPFLVKAYLGFYSWPKGSLKQRVSCEKPSSVPDHVSKPVVDFFTTASNLETFMKFVTMEHKKGEDVFSSDRAFLYSALFEPFAHELCPVFLPRLTKLVESDQESDQRAAAEILYGVIHGTRFHSHKFHKSLVPQLLKLMRTVLANVTTETIGDWENFLSSASNKIDPNRVGWMYELLIEELNKLETLGAFKAAAILRLLNKAIIQQWKGKDLQKRAFELVSANTAHPYKNVRCQVARTLAEVLTFDVKYQDKKIPEDARWSLGQGFPATKSFIQSMLPKLTLNFHNPELQGVVAVNGASNGGGSTAIFVEGKTSQSQQPASGSSKDIYGMDLDTPSPVVSRKRKEPEPPSPTLIASAISAKLQQPGKPTTTSSKVPDVVQDKADASSPDVSIVSSSSGASSPKKRSPSTNLLETMAFWLPSYIQSTSACIPAEYYQLLPFFCQFIGTETDEEVSQACLKALCFLSVCYVPAHNIPKVLDMIWKVSQSTSWKAKLSILEFLQVFVFTNFMSICLHPQLVKRCEDIAVGMLSDDHANVQSKAAKVLCGMIHSRFIEHKSVLLKKFLAKISISKAPTAGGSGPPPAKKPKKASKAKQVRQQSATKDFFKQLSSDKKMMSEYHSGILGLCSLVEAYPHEVPDFIPEVLMELEKHLHDPQPVPKTIKKTLQEFKRTHQDNWAEHKLKFTEDQLLVMTDLLVSPNYYA